MMQKIYIYVFFYKKNFQKENQIILSMIFELDKPFFKGRVFT